MQARVDTSEPLDGPLAPPSSTAACQLYDLPTTGYEDALHLQMGLHRAVAEDSVPGALILLEHRPVITMGVKTAPGNLLATPDGLSERGIDLVRTDRGGDVTYHGPGQLVGYPILKLRSLGLDVHSYLRRLEQTIIDVLAGFGLDGKRHGSAGVWVGEKKVCSIGIAVRRGVTYHGFALNVDPDMSHFALINPCGLQSARITSMSLLMGSVPPMAEVRSAAIEAFRANFGIGLTQEGLLKP